MVAKQHKHKGYGYEIWPLTRNFAWAVVGVHEGDSPHIAGAEGVAATEHGAERGAKAHIDLWVKSGSDEEPKALGSSFVGGVGTVTAHPPAGTVVQEDDGV